MRHKFCDKASHHDTGLPSPERQPNGSWIVWMVLAAPGIMDYEQHGRVYVPPETLQDRAWLDSMAGVPLIDDDEVAHAEGVTLDEPSRIGQVLHAEWDPALNVAKGRAVVDTTRGIDKIVRGVVGVSPAYDADLDDDPGEVNGEKYDKVQRNRRRGDNVTITIRPRGGKPARLQADAEEKAAMTPEEITAIASAVAEAVVKKLAESAAPADPTEDAETTEDPMTAGDADDLKAVADAEGEEVKPTEKLADAFLRIAAKVQGVEVKALTADSARVTIRVAAKAARKFADASRDSRWPTGKPNTSDAADSGAVITY
jgi:hypothetical protein